MQECSQYKSSGLAAEAEILESREQKVLDMMMELFDQEEILRSYVESERYEAENDVKMETAKRILKLGKLSIEEIADGTGLTVEEVEKLAGMQTV